MLALVSSSLFIVKETKAVTGRHPTGVNVNSNGVSTVLITFHNLDANEVPVNAFWCGDVTSTGVVVGNNPCVTGTLLGHLPAEFDLARITGTTSNISDNDPGTDQPTKSLRFPETNKSSKSLAPRNLTDVMSIPTAVIRRAYQQAQTGASSEFFYVRQFVNNGVNTFVTVTCRMGGGGARTPLSITNVDLDFNNSSSRKAVTLVKQGEMLNQFSATINFTGAGLLKGRWEIVMPGDPEPSQFDLLSEASLPAQERMLQKRYRLLSRFQKFLSPTGKTTIQGPDPKFLPNLEKGAYRILLRIEASNDVDSSSDTLAGILNSGGVAGFPMPTLRYFVGETDSHQTKTYPPLSLLLPHHKQTLNSDQIQFSWFELQDGKEVAIYKIEFYQPTGDRKHIASALKKPGESSYVPTKKILKKLNQPFLWRVVAINKQGKTLSSSQLRQLKITE